MGLRKDLDSIKERYIYYLTDQNGTVLYVGTAVNPKQRFKTHIRRSKTDTAILYRYIRKHGIKPKLIIKSRIKGSYAYAEKVEIQHIEKHQNTCLNLYNNPNKERLDQIKKSL